MNKRLFSFDRWRRPIAEHPRERLDPFAFWPNAISRIGGVGGTEANDDPLSAFHTSYASYAPGPLMLIVTMPGLIVTRGTLTLLVNAIPVGGNNAVTVKRLHFPLTTLAEPDGLIRVTITAEAETLYALYGRIEDDTDATATEILIEASKREDESVHSRKLGRAREDIFAPVGKSGLVVAQPAEMAAPLSQMCTAAQFDEPDYARWLQRMHRPMHRHRKQWEFVYICRMLEHMQMLQPQFRGIGFGCGVEPLPAVFASYDIFVTASDLAADDPRAKSWHDTAQHLAAVAELRDPAICPDELFDSRVEYRSIDMNHIDVDRRDYDFCWSSCALEHLGSIANGLKFIEGSLDVLRPGGVAVHTTELNLTSNRKTLDNMDTVLFRRRDIERLAVKLAKQGHEVVPITFDLGDHVDDDFIDVAPYASDIHLKLALQHYVTTSFGLAVRKAA
ncbi:hypothetical protein [Sphingomonas sp. R86521]|uniref:hypothetical protein n=1 Tax=Sphingomonas sp. R86521 TaxID=3093860 RepID=UPI0036D352AD